MLKIMLSCRPSGRRRLGRPSNRLTAEDETGLDRRNSWRMMMTMMMMMMVMTTTKYKMWLLHSWDNFLLQNIVWHKPWSCPYDVYALFDSRRLHFRCCTVGRVAVLVLHNAVSWIAVTGNYYNGVTFRTRDMIPLEKIPEILIQVEWRGKANSGVPRNFVGGGGGVQQIQLRTEDRENGDLRAVAP
jgi:hypothetical protein